VTGKKGVKGKWKEMVCLQGAGLYLFITLSILSSLRSLHFWMINYMDILDLSDTSCHLAWQVKPVEEEMQGQRPES
jgi:hypothetical protein